MKKILVIGSKGFIGSAALRYYESEGYYVVGCDVVDNGVETDYFKVEKIKPDYNDVLKTVLPDLCLNASGAASVPFSFEHPWIDYELNVINVLRILEAIRISNPKTTFINISSAAVYGTPSQLPVNEDANVDPISPYGWHKRQSEILCREYSQLYGLKTCSMRVFSAYGPGLNKQLFWDLYQKTRKGKSIELLGTGDESRDYIFVKDLVRASEAIATKGLLEGEVINVANGIETKIREAASSFIKALGWDGEIRFTGSKRKGDPENWCADISKIKEMGFNSEFSLYTGLKAYGRWLRDLQQL
jgi:dTDP-glucose 4,6-dehydratase/UDP-glucose 4-epimerase